MAIPTVQEVLTRGYSKSTKNQPGRIANEPVELLQEVNRIIKALFSIAAHVNPSYFGKSATMTEAGGVWTEPTDAKSIFYTEQAAPLLEVVVVQFDDQDAEPDSLTVYSLGRQFYIANSNGPSGDVTAYYAKKADEEAALGDTLDAAWDDEYNELLYLEIALYLAIKDGRGGGEEIAALLGARDRELRRFVRGLEHHLLNVRSRWGPARRIVAPENFAPSDLLIQPGKAA